MRNTHSDNANKAIREMEKTTTYHLAAQLLRRKDSTDKARVRDLDLHNKLAVSILSASELQIGR